eukprot:525126-Rhodomonas_salina.3
MLQLAASWCSRLAMATGAGRGRGSGTCGRRRSVSIYACSRATYGGDAAMLAQHLVGHVGMSSGGADVQRGQDEADAHLHVAASDAMSDADADVCAGLSGLIAGVALAIKSLRPEVQVRARARGVFRPEHGHDLVLERWRGAARASRCHIRVSLLSPLSSLSLWRARSLSSLLPLSSLS